MPKRIRSRSTTSVLLAGPTVQTILALRWLCALTWMDCGSNWFIFPGLRRKRLRPHALLALGGARSALTHQASGSALEITLQSIAFASELAGCAAHPSFGRRCAGPP